MANENVWGMQSCDQKKHFVPDVKKECLQRIRKWEE